MYWIWASFWWHWVSFTLFLEKSQCSRRLPKWLTHISLSTDAFLFGSITLWVIHTFKTKPKQILLKNSPLPAEIMCVPALHSRCIENLTFWPEPVHFYITKTLRYTAASPSWNCISYSTSHIFFIQLNVQSHKKALNKQTNQQTPNKKHLLVLGSSFLSMLELQGFWVVMNFYRLNIKVRFLNIGSPQNDYIISLYLSSCQWTSMWKARYALSVQSISKVL